MYACFVGIDIGKWNHQAAFLNSSGDQISAELSFTNTGEGFDLLAKSLDSFDKETTVIGMEATGHYWLALHDFLKGSGWDVKVINPIQTDAMRKVNIRKTKTDRKDAVLVADVIRFNRYTETVMPDEIVQQLKELSRFRAAVVEIVGDAKRKMLCVLDRTFPEFESCFSDVFGAAPTELMKEYADPEELANCDIGALIALLKKQSRGRHSEAKARELKEKASKSVGSRFCIDALMFELKLLLESLEFANRQIKEIDRVLKKLMKGYELICTVPGISTTLGAAIIGEIGDVNRFEKAHQLQAFAGMDPSVVQSGNFQGSRGKMSKRGSPYLRRAIYLAANAARLHNPVFKAFYEKLKAKGKHHNEAMGALGSKLLRVIYAVMKSQKPYNSQKLVFDSPENSSL